MYVLTELKTVSAVDVEIVVARLALVAEGVENKAVGAEPFLRDAVVAFVVFIALAGVLEGAVLLGAGELLGCCESCGLKCATSRMIALRAGYVPETAVKARASMRRERCSMTCIS